MNRELKTFLRKISKPFTEATMSRKRQRDTDDPEAEGGARNAASNATKRRAHLTGAAPHDPNADRGLAQPTQQADSANVDQENRTDGGTPPAQTTPGAAAAAAEDHPHEGLYGVGSGSMGAPPVGIRRKRFPPQTKTK